MIKQYYPSDGDLESAIQNTRDNNNGDLLFNILIKIFHLLVGSKEFESINYAIEILKSARFVKKLISYYYQIEALKDKFAKLKKLSMDIQQKNEIYLFISQLTNSYETIITLNNYDNNLIPISQTLELVEFISTKILKTSEEFKKLYE